MSYNPLSPNSSGHAFCQDCANKQLKVAEESNQGARSTRGFKAQRKGTCPTCRGDVEGWMTARAYDNKIYAIALQESPKLFFVMYIRVVNMTCRQVYYSFDIILP